MLLTSLDINADEFAARTGWHARPEGLCHGDVCVPAANVRTANGALNAHVLSEKLRMPLVHDEAHGIWALGPAAGGKALPSVEAPNITLIDRNGESFSMQSMRGRRMVMVAWASW
jgi:hypothetical protein